MEATLRSICILATGAAAMAACAPAGPREYVAPSNANVQLHVEQTHAGDAQLIYALNESSVGIVITSLHLRDCENVRIPCGPTPFSIIVPPGKRVDVLRVSPRIPDAAMSFRYTFTWEPERSP